MGKIKKIDDKRERKRREQKKIAMQKLRQAIRENPELYEEKKRKERERYHQRKAQGKIKAVGDLTEREKRSIRKSWRNRSKKYYESKIRQKRTEQYLEEHTPPSSPLPEMITPRSTPPPEIITPRDNPSPNVNSETRYTNTEEASTSRKSTPRLEIGKKMRRRHRENLRKEIGILKMKLKSEEQKTQKYKKRLQRALKRNSKEKKLTPRKIVADLLEGQTVSTIVKKKLLFGEVLSCQIRENFKLQDTPAKKRNFAHVISGKVVRKYKLMNYLKALSSSSVFRSKISKGRINRFQQIKQKVTEFYENDESSRMCPGKRDTVTLKKNKKQKRYLNYSLKDLYKKFSSSHPGLKISYALFCKLRPFYVLIPKLASRSTCLCITHANMALIITKLYNLKIIREKTAQEVLRTLTCDKQESKEKCLVGICKDCKKNSIVFLDFRPEEQIFYEQWKTKRVNLVIKGKEKVCQKTIKDYIKCSKADLINVLQYSLKKFMTHERNVIHQYCTVDQIKKQLSHNEVLFHIDFSENYGCKYGEEIQSAHFGGSKPQVTLHTVVTYHRALNCVVPTSFCTLSDSMRHDPAAICAHLEPIIIEIRKVIPELESVHFLSDGPTTQYKNRKMFYLACTYLVDKLKVKNLCWHYSESGHGKGAPDGVGGCIKRTADDLVSKGVDIPDLTALVENIQMRCKGIKTIPINAIRIEEIDALIPKDLPLFKGTMMVREFTWSQRNDKTVEFRKLSCTSCAPGRQCGHYGLGLINYNKSILFNIIAYTYYIFNFLDFSLIYVKLH